MRGGNRRRGRSARPVRPKPLSSLLSPRRAASFASCTARPRTSPRPPPVSAEGTTPTRVLPARRAVGAACVKCRREEDADATPGGPDATTPGVRAALAALRAYKRYVSPLLPPSCRFLPTCSEYSAAAYRRFGVPRGTALTAWRLLRCAPWGGWLGGTGPGVAYDPPRWPPPPWAAEEE